MRFGRAVRSLPHCSYIIPYFEPFVKGFLKTFSNFFSHRLRLRSLAWYTNIISQKGAKVNRKYEISLVQVAQSLGRIVGDFCASCFVHFDEKKLVLPNTTRKTALGRPLQSRQKERREPSLTPLPARLSRLAAYSVDRVGFEPTPYALPPSRAYIVLPFTPSVYVEGLAPLFGWITRHPHPRHQHQS